MNRKKIESFFEKVPGDVPKIGIAYISDKQYIVYKTYDDDKQNNNHPKLIDKVDKWVYPDDWSNSASESENVRRDNIAYIDLYNNNDDVVFAYIHLPGNMELSYSEYLFIKSFLDVINSNNCNIEVKVITSNPKYLPEDNEKGIDHIKKKLEEFVTKNVHFDNERIVGQTLSKEDILKSISFHINLSDCKSFCDLINVMGICDRYYNDSYYRDYFLRVFPNYLEVKQLIDEMNFSSDNMTIVGVSLNNIYDVLNGYYNTGVGYRKR